MESCHFMRMEWAADNEVSQSIIYLTSHRLPNTARRRPTHSHQQCHNMAIDVHTELNAWGNTGDAVIANGSIIFLPFEKNRPLTVVTTVPSKARLKVESPSPVNTQSPRSPPPELKASFERPSRLNTVGVLHTSHNGTEWNGYQQPTQQHRE